MWARILSVDQTVLNSEFCLPQPAQCGIKGMLHHAQQGEVFCLYYRSHPPGDTYPLSQSQIHPPGERCPLFHSCTLFTPSHFGSTYM